MPCENVVARLLLKSGKAKVVHRTPFTIKLTEFGSTCTQQITHGLDTGSGTIGSSAVDDGNNVVYMSEIEVRNDIADSMKTRAKYRRNRRNRKTRYRKARWLHRGNSIKKGRFSPTMTSKLNAHIREVAFVKSILPVTRLVVETSTFDPHALKNPEVLNNKWLYQKGINYGYANTKAYVLTRDGYVCKHCNGKNKDRRLEVHHIIYRCDNGSDEPENLITLCKTCHDNQHANSIKLSGGKKKGQLKHATQMNSIRVQLLKRLACEETFGYITKEHRQLHDLPKEHYIDAIMAATDGAPVVFKTRDVIYKKCVPDGDYQQSKGACSDQPITTGKICGFRKFDKIKYNGREYFIKGRMSTGYAILMDIHVKKVDLKPIPKFCKMERIGARKSWIMQRVTIQNIV